MDIRLTAIAAQAAGTYFLVTDNSSVSTTTVPPNLRIFFVNLPSGPVNTVVVFQQGDTAGFAKIFGTISRKQEKLGNYSVRSCTDALAAGPIGVINLRAFTSDDQVGIAGISPNNTLEEQKTTEYDNVFSKNGFWTAAASNIQGLMARENYLNIANVGTSVVSIFVVASKPINYQPLTNQYAQTIANMTLDVDAYDGLDTSMLLSDTFVDVYVFNNAFDPQTVSTNRFYGQLFNEDGTINFENLDALAAIPESGFNRIVTGTLLPNIVNESAVDISIDTVLNSVYPQTGIIAHINDDVLDEELSEPGVLNVNATNYYNPDGTLNTPQGGSPEMLSHKFAEIDGVEIVDMAQITDAQVASKNAALLVGYSGDIFGSNTAKGNKILSIYEQGTRVGDEIVFTDLDEEVTKTAKVIALNVTSSGVATQPTTKQALAKPVLTIPQPTDTISFVLNWTSVAGAATYSVFRKKSTDASWTLLQGGISALTFTDNTIQPVITYQYYVMAVASDANTNNSFSGAKQIISIAVNGDPSTVAAATSVNTQPADLPTNIPGTKTYSVATLTLSDNLNALTYTRKKPFKNITGIATVPTKLIAYVPRVEQFTDGTSATQSSILDIMNSPAIVKGLQNFASARYLVDAFKSFVESSYKYQFGALAVALDKKNTFVRNIINEPFLRDLMKSTNPLFSQGPGFDFDPTYLPLGGNSDYSTVLLTKFATGGEMSFFFGSGKTDVKNNVYPVAASVSNLFIAKQFPYDVVANSSGILTGIQGLEDNPASSDERLPYEQFLWNPIIVEDGDTKIYGNFTGQKANTSLSQIHNSELLAFIKGQLLVMTKDDPFKKGVYNNYLTTQTEINTFFTNLALAGAIQPNPVVQCDTNNNTTETSKAKIKLIHIEYYGVDSLDKVVFDLNLN